MRSYAVFDVRRSTFLDRWPEHGVAHLGHLFGKLDADSRTGAVATARRLGLID